MADKPFRNLRHYQEMARLLSITRVSLKTTFRLVVKVPTWWVCGIWFERSEMIIWRVCKTTVDVN